MPLAEENRSRQISSAANQALELLGRELNLFTEKKEVGNPGDFDHIADEDLIEFIEVQGELVRELERTSCDPISSDAAQGCYQALGNCRFGTHRNSEAHAEGNQTPERNSSARTASRPR